MKFHSIKMKNFGVFIDQKIDFAHRKGSPKVVTFIIGSNGSGKTTLANAMRWCLFGKTDFEENAIAAIDALLSVQVGEQVTTETTVELQHQDVRYTFSRKMNFERANNQDGHAMCKARPETMVFSCTSLTEDGKTESQSQDFTSIDKPVDALVQRICPDKLRNFIFFNGERIGQLANSFELGSKGTASETIKTAVQTLLGLEAFKNGAMHLNGKIPSGHGIQVVKRKLDVAIGNLSDERLKNHPAKIQELRMSIDGLEDDSKELMHQKSECQRRIEELLETIRENNEAAKLIDERDRLIRERDNQERRQHELYTGMLNSFADVVALTAGKAPVMRGLEVVQKYAPPSDALPFIRAETIDAILKRGRCICGEPIEHGSDQEKVLLRLKSTLPPHSISNAIGDFVKSCRSSFSDPEIDNGPSSLQDYADKALECENIIDDVSEKINNIATQLKNSDGLEARIRDAETLRAETENRIKEIDKEIIVKSVRINDMKTSIDTLERELINDRRNAREKSFYERCKRYVDAISDKLTDYYQVNEEKVVTRLDRKVKETFAQLGLRTEIPSISRDYVFTCTESNGMTTRLSESLSFIAALSAITAIIRLGKELVAEDDTLSSTVIDAVPLVMDAPLSSFDMKRIEAFGVQMPGIVDQLIIFTKDTEGEVVKPIMLDKIGKAYTIVTDSETRSHFEMIEG